jgi:hypothetical protein
MSMQLLVMIKNGRLSQEFLWWMSVESRNKDARFSEVAITFGG